MEKRHRFRLVLALAGVAALVYLPSLRNGFAYDDVPVIPGDPRIHSWAGLLGAFTRPYWAERGAELGLYRPLTSASFGVDWLLGGGAPAWFHAVNVLWHAGACVLAFLLLAELFAPAAALAGALVFAVHPVHVEAVANVVGRAEAMSAVFFLGAALVWMRAGAALSVRRLAAVAALFALALLSKESAATLPAILVLIDAARGEWSARASGLAGYLRRRGPALGVLLAMLAAATAARVAVVGRLSPAAYDPALDVVAGGPERVLTALQAWPVYLRLLLFPRTLLADYGPRILMPAFGWTAAAAAGLALLAALVLGGLVALERGRPAAALGLLWFPVTILPVSNLLFATGILVAERTLYLPSLALSFGVAALGALAPALRPAARRTLATLAAAAIVALAARSVVREPEWASTDTIFAALLRDRPDSFRAHWIHARAAALAGDPTGARAHYDEALRLWPYRRGLLLEAGEAAVSQGRLEYAAVIARMAVERWPDDPRARALAAAARRTP
ncbi:MAG TPA: hypothetical protein VFQ38_20485 [Longimicrobiales bacterium]|nr:hypothetical protein [Longimicrobiales bacterium]